MKKLSYVLSLALPLAIIASASDAAAQRKNSTDKNAPNMVEEAYDATVDGTKKAYDATVDGTKKAYNSTKEVVVEMKDDVSKKIDHMNEKKTPENWLKHENEEINEDYNDAIKKINKSSFNTDNKNLLLKQATENKDLAMKQIKDRSDMMKKHWEVRKNTKAFKEEMKMEKRNRKAVKEVRKILD